MAKSTATVTVTIGDLPEVVAALTAAEDRIAELKKDAAALIEALEFAGVEEVHRYWPPYEGWAASAQNEGYDTAKCPCREDGRQCCCCDPINITARVADLLDPPGPDTVLPEGWRSDEC